jgi:hypothetical protein
MLPKSEKPLYSTAPELQSNRAPSKRGSSSKIILETHHHAQCDQLQRATRQTGPDAEEEVRDLLVQFTHKSSAN